VTTTPPANASLAELWALMAQAGLIPVTVPTVGQGPTGSADFGPAPVATAAAQPRRGTTLTPPSGDALDPLRTAMRAAGLLPHEPEA
jgi:hypothetical protein